MVTGRLEEQPRSRLAAFAGASSMGADIPPVDLGAKASEPPRHFAVYLVNVVQAHLAQGDPALVGYHEHQGPVSFKARTAWPAPGRSRS